MKGGEEKKQTALAAEARRTLLRRAAEAAEAAGADAVVGVELGTQKMQVRYKPYSFFNNFFWSSRVLGFRVHHPFRHLCNLEAGYRGDGLQSWWGGTGI